MSEQKNGLGMVALVVAAVGLVSFVGFDQMRQHARPAAARVEVAPQQASPVEAPDDGLPVFIEGDSVGQPTLRVPPPAPPDSTGHMDQLPPGEVLTI